MAWYPSDIWSGPSLGEGESLRDRRDLTLKSPKYSLAAGLNRRKKSVWYSIIMGKTASVLEMARTLIYRLIMQKYIGLSWFLLFSSNLTIYYEYYYWVLFNFIFIPWKVLDSANILFFLSQNLIWDAKIFGKSCLNIFTKKNGRKIFHPCK